MTRHYSVAQVVELHATLEKIKEDSERWNKNLAMFRREQDEATRRAREDLGTHWGRKVFQKSPEQRKTA